MKTKNLLTLLIWTLFLLARSAHAEKYFSAYDDTRLLDFTQALPEWKELPSSLPAATEYTEENFSTPVIDTVEYLEGTPPADCTIVRNGYQAAKDAYQEMQRIRYRDPNPSGEKMDRYRHLATEVQARYPSGYNLNDRYLRFKWKMRASRLKEIWEEPNADRRALHLQNIRVELPWEERNFPSPESYNSQMSLKTDPANSRAMPWIEFDLLLSPIEACLNSFEVRINLDTTVTLSVPTYAPAYGPYGGPPVFTRVPFQFGQRTGLSARTSNLQL
jgi:hypothetical protein